MKFPAFYQLAGKSSPVEDQRCISGKTMTGPAQGECASNPRAGATANRGAEGAARQRGREPRASQGSTRLGATEPVLYWDPTNTGPCLPPMGPIRMVRGVPETSKIGWRHTPKPRRKMGAKGVEKGCRPVRVETKASAIIRATDILLKRFNDRHRA